MPGHLRTYIWEGGTVPLQIPDPDYQGEGEAPMINNQDPDAGQEWCFAYGEAEWLRGVTFDDALNQTRRIILGIPDEGDVNYEVDCQ
ncbi:MAG: hypothetical protein P8X74_21420 [Reinekea sp.]